MSKFGKITAILMMCLLSACALDDGRPIVVTEKKPKLEVAMPPPLAMKDVQFKLIGVDGKVLATLTMEEYANLSENMEKIQTQLHVYRVIIEKQTEYYTK